MEFLDIVIVDVKERLAKEALTAVPMIKVTDSEMLPSVGRSLVMFAQESLYSLDKWLQNM
jgi:hypothetical protein